jgi:signal transduction histidine kinase
MKTDLDFLAGGGELGRRMRALDWSATPLGPPATWPQSLRSALSILLPSKAQIALFWGPDLVAFYNDAYRPVLGAKHPDSLGMPVREVWSEIWETGLGDLFRGVLTTGEAFWARDRSFILERHGYPEETFFDVSYDPVRDESGDVGGVFCIVSETTGRVVGERRLRTLRDLGLRTADARSADEVFTLAVEVLAENPHDVPFAFFYLDESQPGIGLRGIEPPPASAWNFDGIASSGRPLVVHTLDARFGVLPGGPWPEPAQTAVALPVMRVGQGRPYGFAVFGVSPRRRPDEDTLGFLQLVAAQIGATIANALAHEEERRRAESLAELDRAKTLFFSNVSHEFRTPLTLILGPLDDALGDATTPLPPVQRERLELLRRSARRLQRLVNTLLDFSRIEAGRVQAHYVPTDLGALTADLASGFRSTIERGGLRLVVDCPPSTEPVWVDRDLWEKIVLNLLSNAFKYTFTGEIAVTLRCADDDRVELQVRDTGTGIAPAHLPHLFERFRRVEGVRGRTYEGTGIGLALVQELVRLHGGEVRVESVEGQGSTFTVSLPLGHAHLPAERIGVERALPPGEHVEPYVEEAAGWLPDAPDEPGEPAPALPAAATLDGGNGGPQPAPPAGPSATAPGSRERIVWAEDNADMREYVRRLLSRRYDVEAVADGAQALAAVRARRPDLVLADVMMPRLDGLALVRALRADPATRTLPALLLSARAGEDSRIEGLDAGADDYLFKPFSSRELLVRVAALLRSAEVRAKAEESLREADRRKDEFLAILAHELRNPLGPVRNAAHYLKLRDLPDPELRRPIEMIERQVAQMARLIDDLLDVSRVSRGVLELQRGRLEFREVAEAAVDACRADIDARGQKLHVMLPRESVPLDADRARLIQVFCNLLANANKYTPPGGNIDLEAQVVEGGLEVSVRDDGIGIPAEQLAEIFELFAQVDRSLERQGGLGIGLTLARQLVELHGGTIEAHSAGRGQGSTFVVRLPIAVTAAQAEPPPDDRFETVAPRRILVADDNPDAGESLALLLRSAGHTVHLAADGESAFALAARFRPDVAFLDLGMPRLNGYDLARRIRREAWGRAIPLVAVTGWGQEADRKRGEAVGFDHHLVKPVAPDRLAKLLRGLTPAAIR